MKILAVLTLALATSTSAFAAKHERTTSSSKCGCEALVSAYVVGQNGVSADFSAPSVNATDDKKHTKYYLVKGDKNFMVQVKNSDCSLVGIDEVHLCGGDVCAE